MTASHQILIASGAAIAGAVAPEPTLLVTVHAVLLLAGMWIVHAVERTH